MLARGLSPQRGRSEARGPEGLERTRQEADDSWYLKDNCVVVQDGRPELGAHQHELASTQRQRNPPGAR